MNGSCVDQASFCLAATSNSVFQKVKAEKMYMSGTKSRDCWRPKPFA